MEVWQDVKRNPSYEINSLTHDIRHKITHKKAFVTYASGRRYQRYVARGLHVNVHRLLAEQYFNLPIGCGQKLIVHHINGNGHDNRLCNLQVITSSMNTIQRIRGVTWHNGPYNGDTYIDDLRRVWRWEGDWQQKDIDIAHSCGFTDITPAGRYRLMC